jgi:hypothetical protein
MAKAESSSLFDRYLVPRKFVFWLKPQSKMPTVHAHQNQTSDENIDLNQIEVNKNLKNV